MKVGTTFYKDGKLWSFNGTKYLEGMGEMNEIEMLWTGFKVLVTDKVLERAEIEDRVVGEIFR